VAKYANLETARSGFQSGTGPPRGFGRTGEQPGVSGLPETPRPQAARWSQTPRRPIKRGSRVRHPTLGNGVVLELALSRGTADRVLLQ